MAMDVLGRINHILGGGNLAPEQLVHLTRPIVPESFRRPALAKVSDKNPDHDSEPANVMSV